MDYTAASLLTLYTSLTVILALIHQFYYQYIPEVVRYYIAKKIKRWFNKQEIISPKNFTLVVNQFEEDDHGTQNLVYKACELYLAHKLRSSASRLRGSRNNLNETITYRLDKGEEYMETLEKDGIKLLWKFVSKNICKGEEVESARLGLQCRSFEVSFDKSYKDEVLDKYIPSVVLKYYDTVMAMKQDIHLFTYESSGRGWASVNFKHPFTFDALALEPNLKQALIDDLDRFLRRREFYKRVGKAWKRGYLLYGPPGTGKSSLIAAMANYLRFDIYDLQLASVGNDATLRRLMLSTKNKSILVIEDIDCTMGFSRSSNPVGDDLGYSDSDFDDDDYDNFDESEHKERHLSNNKKANEDKELSLSGLLNFIDGLWSSCGDERIVVFTTNHKERLDPALLRPGRMDMHIHMSYLTMPGFKILARNYLEVSEHALFGKIEELLGTTEVTPAQVAEELIRSEDPDIALTRVVEFLNTKKLEKKPKKKVDQRRNMLKKRNAENNILLNKEIKRNIV